MRLASTFVFAYFAASLFPPVLGVQKRPPSLSRRSIRDPAAIASRQYHIPRALIDVCISLDTKALLALHPVANPAIAQGHLCLCLKDLSVFVKSDIGIALAKLLGGKDNLIAFLKFLINISPDAHHCQYPSHSHSTCTSANPCAFECDPPYVITPAKLCVCPPPLKECNGQCGLFPKGCGSSTPHNTRRANQHVTSWQEAQRLCQSHEKACGVPGHEGTMVFECVDTSTTLESCGGCTTSFPSSTFTTGMDCSRLPGVVTASCTNSRCVVESCKRGWVHNPDRTGCIKFSLRNFARESRRDVLVVDSTLSSKIKNLAELVVKLASVPHSASTSSPTSLPVDSLTLISAIVASTESLVSSSTVAGFMGNIDALVTLEGLVVNGLRACGCVGEQLVGVLNEVVRVTLDLEQWCHAHPVAGPLPHLPVHTSIGLHVPHTSVAGSAIIVPVPSPFPVVVPNNPGAFITFGLDGSVDDLLELLAKAKASLDAVSGPPPLGNGGGQLPVVLVLKLNDLSGLIAQLELASTTATFPLFGAISGFRSLVDDITLDVRAISTVSTALLGSPSPEAALKNLDVIIQKAGVVNGTLGACGCVDVLGLEGALGLVKAVLDLAGEIRGLCGGSSSAVPTVSSTPFPSTWIHYPTTTSRPSIPTWTYHPSTTGTGLVSLPTGLGPLLGEGLGVGVGVVGGSDIHSLLNELLSLVDHLKDCWPPSSSSSLGPTTTTRKPGTPTPTHTMKPTPHNPISAPSIIDVIVKATTELVLSVDVAHVDTMLDLVGGLGCRCVQVEKSSSCGCPGLGAAVERDLAKILGVLGQIRSVCIDQARAYRVVVSRA